jgi:hypothetical protein
MEFQDDVAREFYRKGIWVLKERIKDLAAEQTRAKKCLRVIRKKLKPEVEKLAALKAGGYEGDDYPKHWKCEKRRQKITAYLTVYAKVRGKENCNPLREGDPLYYYEENLKEAQAIFDEAAKIPTTA